MDVLEEESRPEKVLSKKDCASSVTGHRLWGSAKIQKVENVLRPVLSLSFVAFTYFSLPYLALRLSYFKTVRNNEKLLVL